MCLLLRAKYAAHRLYKELPPGFFSGQLLLTSRSQAIELSPLIIVGNAPFGFDPTLTTKAMEGRIQAAVLHLEQIV